MNNNQLKQAIADDIETLKQMNNHQMKGEDYLGARRKWVFRFFCLMWLTFIGKAFVETYLLQGNAFFTSFNDGLLSCMVTAIMASLFTAMFYPFIHAVVFFNICLKNKLRTGRVVWKKTVVFGCVLYGFLISSSLIHAPHHGYSRWFCFMMDLVALGAWVFLLWTVFNYSFGLFAREGLIQAIIKYCSKNKPVILHVIK